MKFGMRKPSLTKSFKARTTGKMKRSVKKALIPGYGKKGVGWIKNPKKAAYNKVYNKTTFSAGKLVKSPAVEQKETTAANQQVKTRKTAIGTVLLWILFLPIMAIIAIWKGSKLSKTWKIVLTALIALIIVLFGTSNSASDTPNTTDRMETAGIQSVSAISEQTSANDELNVSASNGEASEDTEQSLDRGSDQKSPEQDATPPPTQDTTPLPAINPPDNSTFSVQFIDVGQADAALVECDGHYMLIDGGNKGDSRLIYAVLKNNSVTHLDIVVGTHAHEDHIGGIPGAFNYADADLTLCPTTSYDSAAFEDFVKYANLKGNGITVPSVGDTYTLGSATVDILGLNGGSETNNASIVLMVRYGNTSFLFTGDAEREAEQTILNSGVDLSATVLKVGHHGSDDSTTYPFLREIMPQYAVISVGEGNSYGHPTDNTLSRLRDADATILRTDLHGDIVFTSDGKTVSVSTEKSATSEEVMTPGGITIITTTPVVSPDTEPETQPKGTDYVVNKNTKKFHYPSCSSVKKMNESNKMYYTGTRDELIAKGYSPCGNCHP